MPTPSTAYATENDILTLKRRIDDLETRLNTLAPQQININVGAEAQEDLEVHSAECAAETPPNVVETDETQEGAQ